MAYNRRQHLADNIAALELIFMRPEFCLTEQGRKVLNGYSGFGGLEVHPESGGERYGHRKMKVGQRTVSPGPAAA